MISVETNFKLWDLIDTLTWKLFKIIPDDPVIDHFRETNAHYHYRYTKLFDGDLILTVQSRELATDGMTYTYDQHYDSSPTLGSDLMTKIAELVRQVTPSEETEGNRIYIKESELLDHAMEKHLQNTYNKTRSWNLLIGFIISSVPMFRIGVRIKNYLRK